MGTKAWRGRIEAVETEAEKKRVKRETNVWLAAAPIAKRMGGSDRTNSLAQRSKKEGKDASNTFSRTCPS